MCNHLEKVVGKTRPLLYMLGELRYYVSEESAVQIYKTYVLRVIESGFKYVLDGYHQNQISRLKRLQNKALRLCFKGEIMYPSFPLHCKAWIGEPGFAKKVSPFEFH